MDGRAEVTLNQVLSHGLTESVVARPTAQRGRGELLPPQSRWTRFSDGTMPDAFISGKAMEHRIWKVGHLHHMTLAL